MEPQQPQTVIHQPTVSVQAGDLPPSNTVRTRGNWKGLKLTGYLQVFAGIISVLLGIIAIVFKSYLYFVGLPVWGGLCFYVVTGILGIAAGGKQKNGLVATYLTMSVITAAVASAMMVLSGISISNDQYFCPDWNFRGYSSHLYDRPDICSSSKGTRIAIDVVILVVGLMELVVAIVGASLTCSSLCCGQAPSHPMVYYQSAPQVMVAGQPQNVMQYAVNPQQQFVQQPQMGNVVYPGHQVIVNPAQPQFQPLLQPQGQIAYPPAPQGHSQPPVQAMAPPYEPAAPALKGSDLPEDHFDRPLIT